MDQPGRLRPFYRAVLGICPNSVNGRSIEHNSIK